MTPGARIAAAIEVLDRWRSGEAVEKALTGWARGHRFAGSKDRAAIRDHVFDALRCARSYAWLGGAEDGRGLMLGALRAAGRDPAELFTGEGYLRVNSARTSPGSAAKSLLEQGVATEPVPGISTALRVTENPRRIAQSRAYQDGLVELQDASSQAVCAALPIEKGARVLDYCAGGGGKALALAARGARVRAHDANPERMRDLPERARRAGVQIPRWHKGDGGGFDLILADAPCSGSGTWARSPEAKWRLTRERLAQLTEIQDKILDEIAQLAGRDTALAYVTCSVLEVENRARIDAFLTRHPGWHLAAEQRLTPSDRGDGFYYALLTRGRD